ncbi:MAG: hypothetical protein ABFR62_03365 [Bacteroidota bacterium]
MKLPSFIKLNSYKRFDFQPRYYDERKERLERIKAKYKGENSPEATKERIRGSFKKSSKRKTGSSNIRLLLIIAGLLFLAWYFLYK